MLNEALRQLLDRQDLAREASRQALDTILFGEVPAAQVAAFLTLLQAKGPAPSEIAGFADSLEAAAVAFPDDPGPGIDTSGTGGDGKSTFNLSTAAALVAAAAGARVFKHGNRAATSRSGSADLLEAMGVPIGLPPEQAAELARDTHFVFLYARGYHPVLGKVAAIRSSIGFPTVFNLLGPLLNPARVRRQVIGVYSSEAQRRVASALALRGCEHALVLHGAGGLDEATPIGPFHAWEIRQHTMTEQTRDPADLGFARCALEDLQVESAEESRARVEGVFAGEPGPCRDAVLLNAALALEVAGVARGWEEGLLSAERALDGGAVRTLMERLRSGAPPEGTGE